MQRCRVGKKQKGFIKGVAYQLIGSFLRQKRQTSTQRKSINAFFELSLINLRSGRERKTGDPCYLAASKQINQTDDYNKITGRADWGLGDHCGKGFIENYCRKLACKMCMSCWNVRFISK